MSPMRVLGKGRQRSHRIDGEGERGCQSGCCWHLAELERGSVGTLEESRSWSGRLWLPARGRGLPAPARGWRARPGRRQAVSASHGGPPCLSQRAAHPPGPAGAEAALDHRTVWHDSQGPRAHGGLSPAAVGHSLHQFTENVAPHPFLVK